MKFSELWLREWVNLTIDSEALSDQTTIAGLEVGGVEPVVGSFNGVVVGEVVECGQHPNADKLRVTKVNVGSEHLLDVVCDAPNCRQGLKVAVATIGAVLPGDFKIKAAKLRGEPLEGMSCSFSELGISDDHSGIIELPADAPIGIDIREHLKLNDNTIEISIMLNHADCPGIIGVARDAAVLNKAPLNTPEITPAVAIIDDVLPIQADASQACPRYLGRVMKGINTKVPTSLWMKEKLRRRGIRSINAVVDVTNCILLGLGQPMHIFDRDRIEGGIVMCMAKEGETLMLFDGSKAKLDSDTLVIADHNKTLVMGRIFDGEHSGVNDETQNVLLECAFFSPLSVTGRACRHGLRTDVSHHYKHGVDPMLQYKASERATRLLIDLCSGEASLVIDVTYEETPSRRATITLRRSKLDRLIGHHTDDVQVTDILQRLGCEATVGQDEWQAVAPSWCSDMEIEEDLAGEVARAYDYNNIPDAPVQAGLIMDTYREADLSLKCAKMLLNDEGYQEVITYSFADPKTQQLTHVGEEVLILSSPISNEMSTMCLSLRTGLLGTVVYSQSRQQSRVRIFENSLRFVPDTQAPLGIHQDAMLAGAICGNRYEEHWTLAKETIDFYDLKGGLESVLDLTGKSADIESRGEATVVLCPGQLAAIYLKGERIGFIGVVRPELERKLDLDGCTLVFELEWSRLADRAVPQARDISRSPANRCDITVLVAENVAVADVLTERRKIGVNQAIDANLFDVYRGKGVAEGYKSLATNLILQDISRTFEEEEIAATVTRCIEALKERFQTSPRD